MKKQFCLLLALTFVAMAVIAQQRTIYGYIRDSTTLLPVANATVTNASLKKNAQSNGNGFFRLEASPNDLIYAFAKSYKYDTLHYSFIFTDTITIFLSFTGNVLPAVTVKGQYSSYQLDSIARKADFDQSRGTVQKTFSSSHPSGFGLTLNLDKVFKKKYKYQKRDQHILSEIEKMEYVNFRFSPHVVYYYTGYKGEQLRNFIHLYTPNYTWLRQHPANEDVLYYINDKLKLSKTAQHK